MKKYYVSYTAIYTQADIDSRLGGTDYSVPITESELKEFLLDQFIYGLDGFYDASKGLDTTTDNVVTLATDGGEIMLQVYQEGL